MKRVVEAIRAAKQPNGRPVFPDDKKFLERVAWVESKFGTEKHPHPTYPNRGGIWKVKAQAQKMKSIDLFLPHQLSDNQLKM